MKINFARHDIFRNFAKSLCHVTTFRLFLAECRRESLLRFRSLFARHSFGSFDRSIRSPFNYTTGDRKRHKSGFGFRGRFTDPAQQRHKDTHNKVSPLVNYSA